MRLSLALVLSGLALSSGFTTQHRPVGVASQLFSSVEAETDVPIVITGNNIDLTPSLTDYVNKKLERPLGKLKSNRSIVDCEVHLAVNKNPKVKNAHRVEVTTNVKGTTLRTTEESPDMYASIDSVADRLTRKLRRYKERRLDGYHGGKHMGEDLAEALEELGPEDVVESDSEEFVDPEAPKVTKIKSFDLGSAISVEEAIFALDYVDHDFYVFRDADSNEVSVVYKRNAGGIGLIQPQQ